MTVKRQDDLLEQLTAVETPEAAPKWWSEERRAAAQRFREIGLPSTRVEEWKHTSLKPLTSADYRRALPHRLTAQDLPPLAALDLGGPRMVFVDGRFDAALSDLADVPRGLKLGSIAELLAGDPAALEPHLAGRAAADAAPFRTLNSAFLEDGAWVEVEDGVSIEAPLQLIYLTVAADEPTASHPRSLIVAGRESRLTVVESFLGLGDAAYFTNAVCDVSVGDNASVDHCRIQLEGQSAFHVAVSETRQGRDSRYRAHALQLGGRLVRHDQRVVFEAPGSTGTVNGLHLARREQHLDAHTELDHAHPHCSSRELYKSILAGRSRSVFRGRIIVREGAQKTDAVQSNPNLLLSDSALAHSLPQLEIYADDVKCTHGATIGRLDEEAIFYLRSRGLPEADARQLLIEAFVGEILDEIEPAELRETLRGAIVERLPLREG